MGLFDSVADALDCIQDGEGFLAYTESLAGTQSDYRGHPWDELRTIKLEMQIICMKESYPYPIFVDEDYEWLRAAVLKRAVKEPPYEFSRIFASCVKKLWKRVFPTEEAFQAGKYGRVVEKPVKAEVTK